MTSHGGIDQTTTKMAVQAPLVTPRRYDPMFKVDTMLHEPTVSKTVTAAEIGVDIMSLCTQLDAVCKRELMEEPSHEIRSGRVPCSFMETASIIEDRMRHTLCRDRSLPSSVIEYIERTGLNRLFTRPAAFLKDTENFSFTFEQTRIDEYLSSMNKLNQLMRLSHQMSSNVASHSRPKYLAHQVAMLYQCMHTLPDVPSLAKFKKNIQDNFKAIKQIMSSQDQQDQPLPDDMKQWMVCQCIGNSFTHHYTNQTLCRRAIPLLMRQSPRMIPMRRRGPEVLASMYVNHLNWVLDLSSQVAELMESLPAELTQSALLPAYILAQM